MESCLCLFFLYPKVPTLLFGTRSVRKILFQLTGECSIEKVRQIPSKTKINSCILDRPYHSDYPLLYSNESVISKMDSFTL